MFFLLSLFFRLVVPQAFITHGGAQSIGEAIDAGVPMIIIPQGADRDAQAARIVDRGLGEWIRPREITTQVPPSSLFSIAPHASFLTHDRVLSHLLIESLTTPPFSRTWPASTASARPREVPTELPSTFTNLPCLGTTTLSQWSGT